MAEEALLDKVQNLSDLELAALLCLISQEHCIIDTEPDALDELVAELQLVASNVFGLSHCVVDCSEHTSLDDFANSILVNAPSPPISDSPARTRQDSYYLQKPAFRSISRSPVSESFSDNRKMGNIIIAKNLDEAPKQVQIQAVELMRTKRIFTHTSVLSAPKRFLFIALVAGGEGPRLTKHLNDFMYISHFHDPEDGFPNLEDLEDDVGSASSVVQRKAMNDRIEASSQPLFSASDIEILEKQSANVTVTIEIYRYIQNVISFLRMHRAVQGGVSPVATKYFEKLVKCLASLHGLSFVTPTLVALAAKKIYPHRIEVVAPVKERSMQWGSDIEAVTTALEGVGPDVVIDDVLAIVEVPL